MIQRKYSKAKANANHVVWTADQVLPVPFNLDGLVGDGIEFGLFRVPGRDMYCTGYRVDFQVPAGDYEIQCSVGLYTAQDTLVDNGTLVLNGVTLGGTKTFTRPIAMPVNSVWKFKLAIASPSPEDGSDYFPQGVTVTYYLRYAQGPVSTRTFVLSQPEVGVGFDEVGTTLIVQ